MSNTNTEPLDASVTLEEIFAVVSQKRAPLAPELAGYLVLELAEGIGNAGEIDVRYVYVSEEGSVALVRGPNEATGDAEGSLRRLLGKLLETAGAQTPALASVAKRKGGAGVSVLVEELEASLIPVNRSAGKRALARLARETKRVTNRVGRNASAPNIAMPPVADPPKAGGAHSQASAKFDEHEAPTANSDKPPASTVRPPPDESQSNLPTVGISREELDAAASKTKRDSVDSLLDSFEVSEKREDKALGKELKIMAGLEPTKTPPPIAEADPIESLLAQSAPASKANGPGRGNTRPLEPRPVAAAPFAADRVLPTAPSSVKKMQQLSLTSEAKVLRRKGGSGIGVILLFVLILAGFAVALWLVKPGFLTGRTPEKIAAERAAAEAESARIAALHNVPACHATLVVAGAPKDSEILIREGQAPIDVEHMPVGARLEFVATAEGYAPKRAIVPGGAAWDSASGKPRFDLPVQLDKSKARPGRDGTAVDPWPQGEPGSEVGGKGAPGTVHVLSSPKGAEVWLLAGIGPDATIEDIVSCDTDIDVLVAGPTTYRKRLHVPAPSFTAEPSGKAGVRVAHLTVK
jgi:hypothetical protein